MKLNQKVIRAAIAGATSIAMITCATPAVHAQTTSSLAADSALSIILYIFSSVVGFGLFYAFWGSVFNFALAQGWVHGQQPAPGLPTFR
ncbi:hypothetical protein N7326_07035 [Corynebacterium sp. ES2794-CONJ1]|uniref:hypothetical protein n=1 Tax=unclassified Corynebacterium TaxID=2624378 RepID=UPI002167A5A0|nr:MULTISPECIES: hypothetical protein [unclassified Corynebacterium]MCS4490068.1 hypothetical protein [Corynebacterium sp. ES2775-CONJ]MCS4492581.1 hypothetical protein [Corynebacterium sp. ES2715-CONJ3]MCS4532231.1 hypothetical protein [Corynebacterium sp. ES2730-CONJ]MCU9519627.1 hypothetical protein [Corynebacterium sp. ES2794-CONJ1]